jgi:hypothetical protein
MAKVNRLKKNLPSSFGCEILNLKENTVNLSAYRIAKSEKSLTSRFGCEILNLKENTVNLLTYRSVQYQGVLNPGVCLDSCQVSLSATLR